MIDLANIHISGVNTELLGRKVRMHATGPNCNTSFDKVTGVVTSVYVKDSRISVLIDKGCHNSGSDVRFPIVRNSWSYEIIDEWDQ